MQVVPPNAAARVPVSKSSDDFDPPNGMSMCVCTSIPPGSTYLPVASIVLSAAMSSDDPIVEIFSSSTSTSPLYLSVAVTTVPFLISVRMVSVPGPRRRENTKHARKRVFLFFVYLRVFVFSWLRLEPSGNRHLLVRIELD